MCWQLSVLSLHSQKALSDCSLMTVSQIGLYYSSLRVYFIASSNICVLNRKDDVLTNFTSKNCWTEGKGTETAKGRGITADSLPNPPGHPEARVWIQLLYQWTPVSTSASTLPSLWGGTLSPSQEDSRQGQGGRQDSIPTWQEQALPPTTVVVALEVTLGAYISTLTWQQRGALPPPCLGHITESLV